MASRKPPSDRREKFHRRPKRPKDYSASREPHAAPGELPEIGVIEITGVDFDGEITARPVSWTGDAPPPAIFVVVERAASAPAARERAVARFARQQDGSYEARIIRMIAAAPERIVGIFRADREGGRIEPTDRKIKTEFRVSKPDSNGALDGEIVVAEALSGRRLGLPQAAVLDRVGRGDEPRAFSLIAIHSAGIPTVFPPAAQRIAEEARAVALGSRTDLRAMPLVTIDGEDARDFDDAVWAEPDPEQDGGWHLLVAIADVAWYVRAGDALDQAARDRGNSVYFPDRVVPMLPEALSNELCSLKPDVDRACLAAHLWIDRDGRLVRHRFVRGLMRSAARLTYTQVQAALDGTTDATTGKLLDPVLRPLHRAYQALDRARRQRGTLDLDLPERKVVLDATGHIARIEPRPRYDSHKLIEEFMIAANVAAAETLERLRLPCMYRIHDAPDPMKLGALREFLQELHIPGLTLAKGQVVRPRHFNQILERAAGTPQAAMINMLVLRSQAQAVYSPDNIGHFGLALQRYAHFTSPIRRYADLLVHRALIAGHRWEGGDPFAPDPEDFAATAEHISMTERRAAGAERSAMDRYTAAYLAERVGATFAARVNGVTRAGLFVTLDESGADGLVPISTLPGDFYVHDEKRHRLVGRRTRAIYSLGEKIMVTLAEADIVTGSLSFVPAMGERDAAPRHSGGRKPRKNHR